MNTSSKKIWPHSVNSSTHGMHLSVNSLTPPWLKDVYHHHMDSYTKTAHECDIMI